MPSLTVDGRTADLPGFNFQTRVWALEIPGSNELAELVAMENGENFSLFRSVSKLILLFDCKINA